jgi:hypothetical protein
MVRAPPTTGPSAVLAASVMAAALAASVGCAKLHDVALELRSATEAAADVDEDNWAKLVLPALDCSAPYPHPLAALCIQVYTVAADTIVMEATCHDAPSIASNDDLLAFLRGLSPIASGLRTDSDTRVFLRLLGYDDATRSSGSLTMCGVTPSLPGHVDESASPPTLALYLLCHDPDGSPSEAGTVFDVYCASSDFVAMFP